MPSRPRRRKWPIRQIPPRRRSTPPPRSTFSRRPVYWPPLAAEAATTPRPAHRPAASGSRSAQARAPRRHGRVRRLGPRTGVRQSSIWRGTLQIELATYEAELSDVVPRRAADAPSGGRRRHARVPGRAARQRQRRRADGAAGRAAGARPPELTPYTLRRRCARARLTPPRSSASRCRRSVRRLRSAGGERRLLVHDHTGAGLVEHRAHVVHHHLVAGGESGAPVHGGADEAVLAVHAPLR